MTNLHSPNSKITWIWTQWLFRKHPHSRKLNRLPKLMLRLKHKQKLILNLHRKVRVKVNRKLNPPQKVKPNLRQKAKLNPRQKAKLNPHQKVNRKRVPRLIPVPTPVLILKENS